LEIQSYNYTKRKSIVFDALIITFIISLSPFKLIAYLVPFLVFLLLIWDGIRKKSIVKFYRYFYIFILLIILYCVNNYLANSKFLFINFFLSILTYSSFIVLFFIPQVIFDNCSIFYLKLCNWLKAILIIEILIGFIQIFFVFFNNGFSFDLAAGDVIQGTINPFSFWHIELGFNNPIFLCNIIFIILFISPVLIDKKKYVLILFTLLIILLASSIHILICIFFAFFSVFLLLGIIKNFKYIIYTVVSIILLVYILAMTQPDNFSLFTTYFTQIFLENTSPKVISLFTSILQLPYEHLNIFIFGLGPGQYTSRASLIASGHFFGSFENPIKLPFTGDAQINPIFSEYIYDLWEKTETNVDFYGGSIMAKPFFSQLSVLVEFGFVGFVFLQYLFFSWVNKIRSLYLKSINSFQKRYLIIILICAFYIYFLGFFENYWEVTQAIFSGLFLITLFYKNINKQINDADIADTQLL